jgi:hypothetical protein
MKKLFIIVLMLVYGLSSSGTTINLHYCCGKLEGISFTGDQERNCNKCNNIKTNDCCSDKQVSASITSDQQAVNKWVQLTKQLVGITALQVIYNSFKDYSISDERLARGTPKDPPPIPLFIQHCTFRI